MGTRNETLRHIENESERLAQASRDIGCSTLVALFEMTMLEASNQQTSEETGRVFSEYIDATFATENDGPSRVAARPF